MIALCSYLYEHAEETFGGSGHPDLLEHRLVELADGIVGEREIGKFNKSVLSWEGLMPSPGAAPRARFPR
jgi:hypothetical protein